MAWPQTGQAVASRLPHWMQKFAPAWLAVPQLSQINVAEPYNGRFCRHFPCHHGVSQPDHLTERRLGRESCPNACSRIRAHRWDSAPAFVAFLLRYMLPSFRGGNAAPDSAAAELLTDAVDEQRDPPAARTDVDVEALLVDEQLAKIAESAPARALVEVARPDELRSTRQAEQMIGFSAGAGCSAISAPGRASRRRRSAHGEVHALVRSDLRVQRPDGLRVRVLVGLVDHAAAPQDVVDRDQAAGRTSCRRARSSRRSWPCRHR